MINPLKKIFGGKGSKNPTKQNEGEYVSAYTSDGVKVNFFKSSWRESVPKTFKDLENKPDELYGFIITCLQDNILEECLEPAKKLYESNKRNENYANIYGIVLLKNKRLDEAEKVLQKYLDEVGNSGSIITNLAKVYSQRGQKEKSENTMWRALEVDPNMENAMAWWRALHFERKIMDKFYSSLEELCKIPGSWRPQLNLAEKLMDEKRFDEAMKLIRGVLDVAPNEGDALMIISGEMGRRGYYKESLELLLPLYKPEIHGFKTGFNLITSCLSIKDRETGLKLCDEVEKLKRYDYKQQLDNLREELRRIGYDTSN